MRKKQINPSFTGELTADQWSGQRVVAFGDTRVDASIPADKVWRVAHPAADARNLFSGGVRPGDLVDGFAFVLPESLSVQDAVAVLEVQKSLIYLHHKYVDSPSESLTTADVAGVRQEQLPDVIREMNQLRNYPWLMSAPIADKLAVERIGLPVMILLPGKSLQEVLPHLKEIREKCLIVCIARTLKDCLNAGVKPDIVLQLDTYQIQRHFYEGMPDLPESLLVPLSICPFYPYAHKFRGVVMMDSFNMELLPNPARLRESYVSSITACLGLAEVLHSGEAFIAGGDHCFPMRQERHPYEGRTNGPLPAFPVKNSYVLGSRTGEVIEAFDYLIAAAREAEQFAMEIRGTSGTKFHSTTDATLLSPEWFPHAPMERIKALPQLDRTAYLEAIDRVLDKREAINITKVRVKLLKELGEMGQIEAAYRLGGVPRKTLEGHVLTRAVRKMRNPRLNGNVDAVAVAGKLSTKWRESLNSARLLVQAITTAGQGRALPLLCLEPEVKPLQKLLGRIIQGSKWDIFCLTSMTVGPFDGARPIHVDDALDWLGGQRLVFASPGVMREYSYVMDYAPADNVYDMRAIVGPEA